MGTLQPWISFPKQVHRVYVSLQIQLDPNKRPIHSCILLIFFRDVITESTRWNQSTSVKQPSGLAGLEAATSAASENGGTALVKRSNWNFDRYSIVELWCNRVQRRLSSVSDNNSFPNPVQLILPSPHKKIGDNESLLRFKPKLQYSFLWDLRMFPLPGFSPFSWVMDLIRDAWGCFYKRFVDLEPVLKSSQRAGLVQRQMIDFPLNELRMG